MQNTFRTTQMSKWNIVLQFGDPGANTSICHRYWMRGLARPCRILIHACDNNASLLAAATHAQIKNDLNSYAGQQGLTCCGPGLWNCMTWHEKSCVQLLVPVIGRQLSSNNQSDITRWLNSPGSLNIVAPALIPGGDHTTAFSNATPAISKLNSVTWSGNPSILAAKALRLTLPNRQPGLFICYRRTESSRLVDQLHDELTHNGYRVFLDRFSGTPGRYFPQELAAEMADKAVLLVIETPGILHSPWTLWEVAFAHRYRLGLLALNISQAPQLSRIVKRRNVQPDPSGIMVHSALAAVIDFVDQEWVFAAMRRRAFYEGLAAGAAAAGGGTVTDCGDGLVQLSDHSGTPSAVVSPSGRPGQLADVRLLADASSASIPKLLLGQHQHLPLQAYDDLNWLAQMNSISLLGDYTGYATIKSLC